MTVRTARLPLAAALLLGLSGAALAFGGGGGNGGSGSGLSPYAALNGNDRSAGVNNGNYRDPALDPYLRTYAPDAVAPYARQRGGERLILRPYGAPY
jgi:hypothetical protein